jgi:hypothetical protein
MKLTALESARQGDSTARITMPSASGSSSRTISCVAGDCTDDRSPSFVAPVASDGDVNTLPNHRVTDSK